MANAIFMKLGAGKDLPSERRNMSQAVSRENRSDARMNLFMAAAIYVGVNSEPVRVRNVSAKGALIEGAVLPQAGARVRFCRANLKVEAEIIWSKNGRAGLRFATPICVSDWLPTKRSKGQQRVDRIVHDLTKTGATCTENDGSGAVRNLDLSFRELDELRLAIESLAEDLASDSAIVKRHWFKLQTLDLAAQAFGRLAKARG